MVKNGTIRHVTRSGSLVRSLTLFALLCVALALAPLRVDAIPSQSHGAHTLNLHSANVSVNGVNFNTMNEGAVAGTLDTVSVAAARRVWSVMVDSSSISVFASDAVPAGATWDLSGTWTFRPYARVASAMQVDLRAIVYRINTDGTTTQLLSADRGMYDADTTYAQQTWTGTMGAQSLTEGQRFGVAFSFYPDDNPTTGYIGFDHASQASNVSAQIKESVIRQAHYRIGQDTALTSMTWHAATDTAATNIQKNTNFRVRFQLYNNGGGNKTWTPQLEYSTSQTTGYAAVPTSTGAPPFFLSLTSHYANAASIATGNFGLGTGTGSAQAGVAYESTNPAGAAITLNAGAYTEIEFSIQANNNAVDGTTYYFRLTSTGTALTSYEQYAQITVLLPGNVREAHYRIGQDTALTGMTWHAATDTAATGIPQNSNFRVRFQVYNNGGSNVTWTPQLEWSATQGSGYAAVPTSTGAPPFFLSLTSHYANAATINTANFGLGTGTGSSQAGVAYESTNPAGASITLNANSYTEIEFSIQANSNASQGSTYYFRLTNNGTALTAYANYAQITIQALTGVTRQAHYRIGQDTVLGAMTWYATTDTQANSIPRNTNIRVRFQVYNNGAANATWTPRLDWSTTSGSGYAAVPTSSGSDPFYVTDTTQFTNGDTIATGDFGLGTGTGSVQAGKAYDTANPAGASITLNANSYTEIEFNIQANNNAALGTIYYFRLTNSGTALDGYDVVAAQLKMQTPGVVRQAHYRIGQDSELIAMSWRAATDTAATGLSREVSFRVRFQLYNDGELGATWTPRLDWTATSGSGYAAVPTSSGASAFYVADTLWHANGTTIATGDFGLGTGTGSPVAGISYDTANPAGASISLGTGSYTEVEFNIRANSNATLGNSYYFRLSNNGSALDGYVVAEAQITMQAACSLCSEHYRIGKDNALNAMTWHASTDTPATSVSRNQNFRVRFQLYNNGGTNTTWTPRLEWTATSGSGYAAVPTTTGSAPFFVSLTTHYADAATINTTDFGLGTGIGAVQAGRAYESTNPAGATFTLNAGSYTEIEYSIQANNNAGDGVSYYFRLTNNGTVLTYIHSEARITVQITPPPTPTAGPPAHNQHQPYSADTSACAACHRVHTAKSPGTLYKKWPQEQVCFTCHDGTGAPNIMSQFSKTYKMPLSTTSTLHTLAESRLRQSSSFTGANRHVSCADCHNPHYAAAGNHTVGSNYAYGPQQGVWGVVPSYTGAWTTPTFSTTNTITYQYELCFKCHSSWAWGSNPPTSPGGGFAQTDVAKEFNPQNPSYMPVMAVGKNPFVTAGGTSYASSLIGGFTPSSRMVCSDCHSSETPTDPAGPHGSSNSFILKGQWDRTTGQTGTQNHLCFKCHAWSVYGPGSGGTGVTGFSGTGSGENWHGVMVGARNKAYNDNPIVCMDCHVAIPHGYFRDHLLGFTGDAAPYINRPYSGGLTTINTWKASGQWVRDDCSTAMQNCR